MAGEVSVPRRIGDAELLRHGWELGRMVAWKAWRPTEPTLGKSRGRRSGKGRRRSEGTREGGGAWRQAATVAVGP